MIDALSPRKISDDEVDETSNAVEVMSNESSRSSVLLF